MALCLLADPAKPPHRADGGRLICEAHRQELSSTLRDVQREAGDVRVVPSAAIVYGTGGGAPAFERAPARLEAIALGDPRHGTGVSSEQRADGRYRFEFDETGWDPTPSVLETLGAWTRLVRAGRRIDPPTVTVLLGRSPAGTFRLPGPACPGPCPHESCLPWVVDVVRAVPTVAGERQLLSRQLDWIAGQDWVTDFRDDLRDLLSKLRRVNETLVTHVGTCGSLLPSGSLCEGLVWHIVIKPDGRVERGDSPAPGDEPGFRCAACRRVWTGTDALRKRNDLWLEEQRKRGSA